MLIAEALRLRWLVALLPPVCLVLLAGYCSLNRHTALARGYVLDVATVPPPMAFEAVDLSNLVATATGNGRAKLNNEAELPLDRFAIRIKEVLSHRSFRQVYVKGDRAVSWGDFMNMVDCLSPETEVLSLITPEVDAAALQQHRLAPSCGTCDGFGVGH